MTTTTNPTPIDTMNTEFGQPSPAERAAVGALLLLPLGDVLDVLALLADDDPGDPKVRFVLRMVREVATAGDRPDAAAVWRHAQATGAVRTTRLGLLAATLADLSNAETVPIPLAARANAHAAVQAAVRRRVVEAADRLRQAADDADVDTLPTVAGAELAAVAAACRRLTHPPVPTPREYVVPDPPVRPTLVTTSWEARS